MKNAASCILSIICLAVIGFAATTVSAQSTATSADAITLTGMPLLFQRTRSMVALTDAICDTASCHDAVATVNADVEEASVRWASGGLQGSQKKAWHKQFGADLLTLQSELVAVERRREQNQPVIYKEQIPQKPCKRNAAYTCDNVLQIGLGLCAAYGLLSAPAGAICVVATLYGYSNCLAQNGG